jgi:membrane-bound ClpP family serine protease
LRHNAGTIPPTPAATKETLHIRAKWRSGRAIPPGYGPGSEERSTMPFAVALLCHPVGTFAALVAAIVATLYAAQSQRFLPSFTAASATLLTLLAFLQVPPSATGLAWLGIGVALLHAEFLWPTFGAAGLLGVGAAAWSSWTLLAALAPVPRGALALLGAAVLLAAVARTMRLRTLPP